MMQSGSAMLTTHRKAEPARARDRRRHSRVKVTLLGRYMLADRREFPCQTIDMSPGGVLIFAPVKPGVGERVVVYLDQVGRIEGVVMRHVDNGFALAMNVPQLKREKLADQLTWLANRHVLGMPEDRRHDRIVPRQRQTTLKMPDGQEFTANLIDISLSGCAITIQINAPLGTLLTVGRTQARIVRKFEGGIGVEFLRLLPIENFDESIVL